MSRHISRIAILTASVAMASGALAEPVADGGRKLQTSLTGGAEVPGPGDADGSGTATVTVNPGQARVCYTLSVTNIATPTAAHIHVGPVGVAGPVVVPLAAPATGSSEACADSTRRWRSKS